MNTLDRLSILQLDSGEESLQFVKKLAAMVPLSEVVSEIEHIRGVGSGIVVVSSVSKAVEAIALLQRKFSNPTLAWVSSGASSPLMISKLVRESVSVATSLQASEEELREVLQILATYDLQRKKKAEVVSNLRTSLARLTEDERKVLRLITLGASNKSIASSLNLGLRTVEKRRHHVFHKLRAGCIPDLVRITLVEEGLLDPSIFESYPLNATGEITMQNQGVM